ncbi:hypothetical protein KCU87_g194, partial [Aureobasidium melanogenum]
LVHTLKTLLFDFMTVYRNFPQRAPLYPIRGTCQVFEFISISNTTQPHNNTAPQRPKPHVGGTNGFSG